MRQHSTETAVLNVVSDILKAADDGKVTVLGLLDISAAFDTVDHAIFNVRHSYRLDVCPSVCPSVRHTLILCRNGSTYRQTVFTVW